MDALIFLGAMAILAVVLIKDGKGPHDRDDH